MRIADSVNRQLANTQQDWLLVFDNADDPELDLAPYFPAGDRGDVIITSRNPGVPTLQHGWSSARWTAIVR